MTRSQNSRLCWNLKSAAKLDVSADDQVSRKDFTFFSGFKYDFSNVDNNEPELGGGKDCLKRCYAGSVRRVGTWTICFLPVFSILFLNGQKSTENKTTYFNSNSRADLKCPVTFVKWFQLVSTIKGNMYKEAVQF